MGLATSVLVAGMWGCSGGSGSGTTGFSVAGVDFTDGGTLPLTAACVEEGGNNQIQISWSNAPAGTLSYAVIVIDPSGTGEITNAGFVHGVGFNIGANVASTVGLSPSDITFSPNDNSTSDYFGACPPEGETHTYEITVYAMSIADLTTVQTNIADTAAVMSAISSNAISDDTITGQFTGVAN